MVSKKISNKKRTKIPKKYISVDHLQQHKEKNISWMDYPCLNKKTGRKLRRPLGYYFSSWKDYIDHGGEKF